VLHIDSKYALTTTTPRLTNISIQDFGSQFNFVGSHNEISSESQETKQMAKNGEEYTSRIVGNTGMRSQSEKTDLIELVSFMITCFEVWSFNI